MSAVRGKEGDALQRVIVIGGKGTAVNIAEQISDARDRFGSPMELAGFAIDDASLGKSIAGHPVLCPVRDAVHRYASSADVRFIFALYKPDRMEERVKLLADLAIPADRLATFVHPLAYVSPTATIGRGSVIMSGASVHHGAGVGACSVICSSAVIEHDSVLGDSCFVAACACIGSYVTVGQGSFIGLNASVREGATVGPFAFVGMGSVVVQDVPDRTLVVGVPAKSRA